MLWTILFAQNFCVEVLGARKNLLLESLDQPTVNQPPVYNGGGSVAVAVGVSDR